MNTLTRLVLACMLPSVPWLPHAAGDTLSPAEAAAGWIQLFDGETLFGWKPRGPAVWEVVDGAIVHRPDSGRGMLGTTTEFADFELSVEFWVDAAADSGVFLRCPAEGEVTHENASEVSIGDQHPQWPTGSLSGRKRIASQQTTAGRWSRFDVRALGPDVEIKLNGAVAVETRDARFARGPICLQYWSGPGPVKFRNVKLRPLGLKSLFNGKDLAGWKEIPGRKSVYSVTPQGWLNVRNGNGDLQSVETFADFVFQLDIISNGQHLNSGVFFRALPGQFWSGYESQIRNQWEGDDRARPVDFGTGGIYNRQPARRVVSTDGQWFTKTIIAHGRHMAVWIDGYLVSDFQDNRPPQESARQGYRAQAGVLSLQGHDPTTDLSFRNLRIAELPAASR